MLTNKDQRTKEKQDELGNMLVTVFDGLLESSVEDDDRKRENANINAKAPMGKMQKIASELSKAYYLNGLLPEEQSVAHIKGDIHIHDLDFLTECFNCCQMDLGKLLKGGWHTEHGYLREPQRIISALALAAISLQSASVSQFGGISHNAFDFSLAPYIAKEFRRQYSNAMADALYIQVDGFDGEHRLALKDFYENLLKEQNAQPQIIMSDAFLESERDYLSRTFNLGSQQLNKLQSKVYDSAYHKTDILTHEAMVSFTCNVNTMQCRAAGQVVFGSVNLGTDTSPEGRMITKHLLSAMDEGLGNGETCIFPIVVFKLKKGVSYNPEDPNYDLFKTAMRVSAKRLYPNFVNLDAPFNAQYYKVGRPETEVSTMGCRTRVIGNTYDPENEVVTGRGNIAFVTINLPRLAIEADHDMKTFWKLLDAKLKLCKDHLMTRMGILSELTAEEIPFHMLQNVWLGSESLAPTDKIGEVLKHGSLSIGYIGLAECLSALTGKHHGESEESQELGLKIVQRIRDYTDLVSDRLNLNFSTFQTPAEGLSGRFVKMDRERYGSIDGVTDREYYTNSSHVPVWYNISVSDKIRIEAPYHELSNAGHIGYVELDGDPTKNLAAFEFVIRAMHDANMGYFSINHPVDQDPVCGYVGIINDVCPKCGRKEFEEMTEKRGIELGLLKDISEEEMDRQENSLRYCCY